MRVNLRLPPTEVADLAADAQLEARSSRTTSQMWRPLAPTPPSVGAERQPVRSSAGRAMRVLVVDTHPPLVRLAATLLERDGHTVYTAHSGRETLACLAHHEVDVVLSELGLGAGMDGWALAASIKEHWPTTAFVLLSVWGRAIDPAVARTAGVDAVVAKPYRPAELRDVLSSL